MVIPEGQPLLSWGLPFGVAVAEIQPGEYVCNQRILEALAMRHVDFALLEHPNFKDLITRHVLDKAAFQPEIQAPRYDHERFFRGYHREGRGVGTRNYIVVMGPLPGPQAMQEHWPVASRVSVRSVRTSMA